MEAASAPFLLAGNLAPGSVGSAQIRRKGLIERNRHATRNPPDERMRARGLCIFLV